MEDAKQVKTPVNVNSKLMKATEDSEFVDKGLYQSAVGSARFCSSPTTQHWTAVKRIFRYLRGTTQLVCSTQRENQTL